MESPLFRLPGLLPEDAVLCGPSNWAPAEVLERRRCVALADPAAALQWLVRDAASGEVGPSRLILIHQDVFAGGEGDGRLVEWLGHLTDLKGPFLPILLHGRLPSRQLVGFFRAGLFDALCVPVEEHAWINMLIRAERKLEVHHQQRLILATTGRTQDLLRGFRRELEDRAVRSTGELLRAQESLEAANRQLHDAMAELSLLYRFGRELSNAANWDEVLRRILQTLSGFVGARGAALILRSAPGGAYSPRQTFQWEESAWDKVLVALQDQVDTEVARSILAPGIYRVDPAGEESRADRGIIALPLEHQGHRLGFLLLLTGPGERREIADRFLPFLQAVQIVIAEEVASAQMLDRIRDIGVFNTRVLETVRSAIWVLDETGRTVYCNRSAQELLTGDSVPSMEPAEFLFRIGRGELGDVAPDEGTDRIELIADGRLKIDGHDGLVLPFFRERPDGTYRGEGLVTRPGGRGVPVQLQTSLMPGRRGDSEWLVMVAEDLRETRKLEVERLKSDRLQGLVEMSATLAHEIRNPLMGLSAQAELLADQLPGDDPRGRYISVITREVERIDGTITRMLNFVRPYEPEYAPTDLGRLVADAVALCGTRADEAGVDLDFQAVPDLRLDLDSGQIKQVLLNLLLNAIDAAPVDGSVHLAVTPGTGADPQEDGHGISVTVTDDGPGFGDADPAQIFRPFFTTKSSGTGLGLSICQKIVSAHGGEIRADRRDGLTVFQVLLPGTAAAIAATVNDKEAT